MISFAASERGALYRHFLSLSLLLYEKKVGGFSMVRGGASDRVGLILKRIQKPAKCEDALIFRNFLSCM